MHKCIFCLLEKTNDDFTREHVIPQSFGLFGTYTLTLCDSVCGDCNQKFGNTIDLRLARLTVEGSQRFASGIKDKSEYNPKKHGPRLIVGHCSFLRGQPLMEIAYRNVELKNNQDLASKKSDRLYIDVICEENYTYTLEVFRGIAKIAFNYLAYFRKKQLVLQECFNPIRQFISEGIGEMSDFIEIKKEPILPDINGYAKDAHFVTIENHGSRIYASVSLHGCIHYRVCLAESYEGELIRDFGHLFDPHNKSVKKLSKSPLYIPQIQMIKSSLWLPSVF